MTDLAATDQPAHDAGELEQYRVELTGYCYRMLGSTFEAEDAVQETMVRAWRGLDRFEGRSALRSWMYRIATNVCLDMLNGAQRRARPMDLSEPRPPVAESLGPALPEATWIQPMPDSRVMPSDADPAEQAVLRESVRLAFMAAVQQLPARQRAVLILREVLGWRANEVAELLETSVASVNSALQRARATLAASQVPAVDAAPAKLDGEEEQKLLARYVDAFERYDLDALTSLLHEDAVMSMPPFNLWLQGPPDIRAWLVGPGSKCAGSRLVPVTANGSPAFGHYHPADGGGFLPWALQVLEFSGDRIIGFHSFLDAETLFPLFDLPPRLD